MTGTRLFVVMCMGLLAGCGQGAVGWMVFGGVCLALVGCAKRRAEPAHEEISMTAIEAETVEATNQAPAVAAAPVEAAPAVEAPAEPTTAAEAPRRPIRSRVRPRVTEPEPTSDDIRFAQGISRAAPNWHRERPQARPVEAKARPIETMGIRSRAGGRWENER